MLYLKEAKDELYRKSQDSVNCNIKEELNVEMIMEQHYTLVYNKL